MPRKEIESYAEFAQNSGRDEFAHDYNHNSDSEEGFQKKLKMVEGESYTPPFDTLGFDQPKLCMDDINRLRSCKLRHHTKY